MFKLKTMAVLCVSAMNDVNIQALLPSSQNVFWGAERI